MQWNVGVDAAALTPRALIEVSYVGSRGDNLIRPTDINYPQPAEVVCDSAPSIRRGRSRVRRDHHPRDHGARAITGC